MKGVVSVGKRPTRTGSKNVAADTAKYRTGVCKEPIRHYRHRERPLRQRHRDNGSIVGAHIDCLNGVVYRAVALSRWPSTPAHCSLCSIDSQFHSSTGRNYFWAVLFGDRSTASARFRRTLVGLKRRHRRRAGGGSPGFRRTLVGLKLDRRRRGQLLRTPVSDVLS